jgi:hypothetical protein
MKNKLLSQLITSGVLLVLAIGFILPYHPGYAQITNSTAGTSTTPGTQSNLNTFSARGSINSLVINDGQATSQVNNHTSWILGGNWMLEAINRNVTDFNALFTMVHFDGTDRHMMSLINFKPANTTAEGSNAVQIHGDGSATITGTVDVTENKNVMWTNVNAKISIDKYNTISISLDNQQTKQHFNGQPIRGVVNAFTYGFMEEHHDGSMLMSGIVR